MNGKYYQQLLNFTELVEVCLELYNFLQEKKVQAKHKFTETREASFADLEEVYSQTDQEDRVIPLEASLKNQFETAFDADLSIVRIHTGQQAHKLAFKMDAEAITIGTDIFFADGKYNPHTKEGVALLAHELKHAVQFLNGAKMTFHEDRQALEHTAEQSESTMQLLELHSIRQPHLMDKEHGKELEDGREEPRNETIDTTLNQYPTLEDFLARDQKPLYRIEFPSGKVQTFSAKERQWLLETAIKKLNNYLSDLRMDLPEEEYSRQVIKFMNLLKRGAI
jgi:hypothetical protein